MLVKSKDILVATIISMVLVAISFVSATILTIEKLEVLADPTHIPSCSINPLLSCSPVMASWQAALFGIPNPIVGMIGFAVAFTLLLVSLYVTLPKWMNIAYFVGVALATVFIGWLISQSLFSIGALCIYCMIVWACIIPLFWITFAQTFRDTKLRWLKDWLIPVIIASYVTVLLLIFVAFQDYWMSLF